MSRTDESNISFSITKPEFTNVAPTNEIALEETQDGTQVTSANEDEKEYITGLKLATVVASLTIVAFLLMMDTTIVTTVIPVITNTFNSLDDIGWYTGAYLLSLCALQPLSGKIYQHYTSKVCFMLALFIFEIGSLISGVATSSNIFIVGRTVAGMGGAGILNGALTIISASAPLHRRPAITGILLGCSSIGLVIGPIIGGLFTDYVGWRWCFYINLPIGAITAAVLFFVKIPDASTKGETKISLMEQLRRLDLWGFIIFAPAIIIFLLALEWGGVRYAWGSAMIIGLFCGSVILFGAFFAWEHYQGETAMIPFSVLQRLNVFSAAVVSFSTNGALILVTVFLPLWFQVVKNVAPTTSGVYFLPSIGSQIIGAVMAGFLISKFGRYSPLAIGASAVLSISLGLMTTLTVNSAEAAWICYQLIFGIARGLMMQIPIIVVQAALPKDQIAVGTALVTFFQPLGGALFTSLGQTVLLNELPKALAVYAPNVNATEVIAMGATNFRAVVDEGSVDAVVLAYNEAITTTFYLSMGGSLIGFLATFGLGWINLKSKKK